MAASGGDITGKWQFWVDRGGTFTDVVARDPNGRIQARKVSVRKSRRLRRRGAGRHPAVPRHCLRCADPLRAHRRGQDGHDRRHQCAAGAQGRRHALVITRGLEDQLEIGYQARPDIFARRIVKPEMLYTRVIERTSASARMARSNVRWTRRSFATSSKPRARRHRRIAIVLMHAYAHPEHERQAEQIAREAGFTQISVSHEVSPLIKIVGRGDTTVADAYLSPVLKRYVDRVSSALSSPRSSPSSRREAGDEAPTVLFMASSGGLKAAELFQGRDAILSGPAGGIVGMAETAKARGVRQRHRLRHGRHVHRRFAFRRRVRALVRDRGRRRAHARANDAHSYRRRGRRLDPSLRRHALSRGPRQCRRQSGAEVLPPRRPAHRHRCQRDDRQAVPDVFPAIFGPQQRRATRRWMPCARPSRTRRRDRGRTHAGRVADGSIRIAVENMANAIKKISVAARLRRDSICAEVLRLGGRPARLPHRRHARHGDSAHPSAVGVAVGVRHGAGPCARAESVRSRCRSMTRPCERSKVSPRNSAKRRPRNCSTRA